MGTMTVKFYFKGLAPGPSSHNRSVMSPPLRCWRSLLESLTIDVLKLHFGVWGPFIFTMLAIESSPSLSSWNVFTFEVLEEVSVGKWGGSNPIEPLQNEHRGTAATILPMSTPPIPKMTAVTKLIWKGRANSTLNSKGQEKGCICKRGIMELKLSDRIYPINSFKPRICFQMSSFYNIVAISSDKFWADEITPDNWKYDSRLPAAAQISFKASDKKGECAFCFLST